MTMGLSFFIVFYLVWNKMVILIAISEFTLSSSKWKNQQWGKTNAKCFIEFQKMADIINEQPLSLPL